ncbi:condensation domain-containing protein, partial [Planctomycetota bacterium]
RRMTCTTSPSRTGNVGQKRLWFIDGFTSGMPAYNVPGAIHFLEPLNLHALETALSECLGRHDALRTTLPVREGEVVQVIRRNVVSVLPFLDLTDRVKNNDLPGVIRKEIRKPFDLARGPLVRYLLVTYDEDRHVLVVTMHHSIADGTSAKILVGELAALYQAFRNEKPSPLPDLPVQFSDYVLWEQNQLAGSEVQGDIDYWREQLSGVVPLELPTDRPRPGLQSYRGASAPVMLPEELSRAVIEFSRDNQVTPFMTLLAAFDILLHRYSGQTDIAVGTPVAGRTHHEFKDVVGCFVNMLVLRSRLDPDWTVRDLLTHVRTMATAAYGHQSVPFDWLVDTLKPKRDPSRSPLCQVALVLQPAGKETEERLKAAGLRFEKPDSELGTSRFDLMMDLSETEGGIRGIIEYNTDLFDPQRIEQMARNFQVILASLIADTDSTIHDLDMLTESEGAEVLQEWNNTVQEFPDESCLHELFENQAALTPNAPALVFEEQTLTYEEFNRRANRLAHYLRTMGVGPDSPVGICAERSMEMVIGLYGILKAGGAYVPLDPSYPARRLRLMIDDAGMSIVVRE